MEIKDIRYFLMVADEASFTRAAEKLYITQPALSRKIADLEAELGLSLIRRRGKTIELTEHGMEFQRRARRLEREYNDLISSMNGLRNGSGVCLRLAYGMAGHIEYLADALCRFSARNSYVQIKTDRMFNFEVLNALEKGTADVGIINLPELPKDSNLRVSTLLPCGLCVFLRRDHPLFNRSSLRLSDLAGENYITFERSTSPRQYDVLVDLCRKHGLANAPLSCAPDTSTFSLLMATNRAVGIMPYTTSVYDALNIRRLPLTDTEGFDMIMIWKPENETPELSLLASCF